MERRSFTYMCLTVCESHPVASFLQALLGVPPRSDGIMFFITPRPKRDAPAFLFPATFQQFIRYKNLTLFFFFLFPFLLTVCLSALSGERWSEHWSFSGLKGHADWSGWCSASETSSWAADTSVCPRAMSKWPHRRVSTVRVSSLLRKVMWGAFTFVHMAWVEAVLQFVHSSKSCFSYEETVFSPFSTAPDAFTLYDEV